MVHDFSHLHIPGKYDLARHFYDQGPTAFFETSDFIFTPSLSTKKDLNNLCGLSDEKCG